ncbi:single-stranded DNA-binding protein [bacterium]|nr:single-stranded DNA-binding protein [bacterium]
MAFNYNHATLVGRLTRDPEIKQISETVRKTYFTIAVNRGFRKTDEKQDTDFIPISLWGKSAELAYLLLKKGTPVLVTGRIQNRVYEKNDVIRSVAELVGEHFQILEKKPVVDSVIVEDCVESVN